MFVNSSTELMSRSGGSSCDRAAPPAGRLTLLFFLTNLLPRHSRKSLASKGYENRQVHEPYCNANKCTRKLLLSTEAVVETWSCASPELSFIRSSDCVVARMGGQRVCGSGQCLRSRRVKAFPDLINVLAEQGKGTVSHFSIRN